MTSQVYWRLRTAWQAMADRVESSGADRGDIPGWVLVTLMSAVLAVAIIAGFRGPIVSALNRALDSVT